MVNRVTIVSPAASRQLGNRRVGPDKYGMEEEEEVEGAGIGIRQQLASRASVKPGQDQWPTSNP